MLKITLDPEFKFCRDCRRSLPKDQFYRNVRNRDNLTTYCKECHSKRTYESTERMILRKFKEEDCK